MIANTTSGTYKKMTRIPLIQAVAKLGQGVFYSWRHFGVNLAGEKSGFFHLAKL